MLYYEFVDFLLLFYFFGVQKINQKNTWELNLIDHLTEVIKVEEEDDAETNFQKVRVVIFVDYVVDNAGLLVADCCKKILELKY